jgi:predicted RNA binding protein YcfA (HicA-like mRNA interferase family)
VTRLPVVSGKDIIKYLSNEKGFTPRQGQGSHVFLMRKNNDGTMSTTTVPLHSELDTGTLKGILNDVGIEREQFIREWHGR